MQGGKWIEKRKELKIIIIKKRTREPTSFLQKVHTEDEDENPLEESRAPPQKALGKPPKQQSKAGGKGRWLKESLTRRRLGFVWFEWQKREFFLALVFQSEAIRKEEEKGGQILLCIELHAKALQPFD